MTYLMLCKTIEENTLCTIIIARLDCLQHSVRGGPNARRAIGVADPTNSEGSSGHVRHHTHNMYTRIILKLRGTTIVNDICKVQQYKIVFGAASLETIHTRVATVKTLLA